MDGEPVITCERLDELITSRIDAEPPRTRARAERAHEALILASLERGDPDPLTSTLC
jgi:hypothetical protein